LRARGRPLERGEFADRVLFSDGAAEEAVTRGVIAEWTRRYPGDPKAAFASRLLDKRARLRRKS
jgi:hypothetical protein